MWTSCRVNEWMEEIPKTLAIFSLLCVGVALVSHREKRRGEGGGEEKNKREKWCEIAGTRASDGDEK